MSKAILRLRLCLLLLLLAIFMTGCVSFASVKQTATIGTQLSAQESVLDTAPAFCRIANTDTKPNPACDQLESDLGNWRTVNRSLVAYAMALNAMADDSKDKSYKNDISTLLGAAGKIDTWSTFLPTNVATGVSTGVDALVHLIFSTYRRAELKQTIEKNDTHIQNIAVGFDQVIAAIDEADHNIQTTAETALSTIDPGVSPENDAMRIAYMHLSMAVGYNRTELRNYKKAIAAFAKAHHDLKEHISKVGDRTGDLEVLQMIANDVITIYASIDNAVTPPKK